uniref:Gastrokine 1 n=1 Tax=Crocodylus porosus TaxID=8502 RepID=A0A7M4G1U3_CROPO
MLWFLCTFQIVIASLLGVLLAPVLANDVNNQGNKARRPYQTLSISNNKHVANIDMNDGWNSWNLVWDEETCYLYLPKAALHAGLEAPPAKEVLCLVSETTASDLASFGQSIQAQCKGVPTYIAHHVQGPNFSHEQCFRLNLGFIHINFCTYINK